MPEVVTDWIDTLQVRDDNRLIVGRGDLVAENVSTEFSSRPDWFEEVYGTFLRVPPSRRGNWGALQALGGPLVTGAIPCVWEHAWNGDGIGSEGGWDGTCTALGSGLATRNNWRGDVYYRQTGNPDPGGPSESVVADIVARAEALWLGAVHTHIAERGVFSFPDPADDGAPDDAELEWEGPLVLLSVEVATDLPDDTRPTVGTVDATDTVRLALRRQVAPEWLGGDPFVDDIWAAWTKGDASTWDGSKSDLSFTYTDGPSTWVAVDGVVSGDTGWEGLGVPFEDAPDEVVTFIMERALDETPPDADRVFHGSSAGVAVRYTFQSPRYRWIYTTAEPEFVGIPPRRVTHRPDGLTNGAPRMVHGGNTRQSGNRTHGSIL